LVALTFGQNAPTGANRPASPKSMSDIVFIIDEGTTYTQKIQTWLSSAITNLEQTFISNQPNMKQSLNRYGLVLFGGLNSTGGRNVSIAGKQFNTVSVFLSNLRQQLTGTNANNTGKADGYSAMNLALNLPFRPNATTIFILISTRYRDVVDQTLTRNVMLNKLKQHNVLLNVVMNTTFVINELAPAQPSPVQPPLQQYPGQQNPQIMPGYTRAMGILFNDQIRDTYYINENSISNPMGYSMNGHIDAAVSSFTTADDYVFFAEELVRDACTQEVNPSASDSGNSGSSANSGNSGNSGNKGNKGNSGINGPQPRIVSAAFDIKYIIEGTVINFWEQLFSMILNLEVVISTQGIQLPSPPAPAPQPTTPPTNPIVNNCPPQSAIFRTRLYNVLERMGSEQQASQDCQLQGGSLANVTEENSAFLAQLATNYTIAQSVSFSDQAVWINSWDGDNYNGAPILFFRGTVYSAPNANEPHYGLCELSAVPTQCTDIGVSG